MAIVLVLTAALCICAHARQGQQLSNDDFLTMSTREATDRLDLRALDMKGPLEKQIAAEASRLDRAAGFTTSIAVGRGTGTASHPKIGIVLDLEQLEEVRRASGVEVFLPVLRWILAHEKAHQVQYRWDGSIVAMADVEGRQVLEAQADLLAGKYLIETLSSGELQPITDTLRVAFDIGTERFALADHPQREARMTAVRLGMAAGMVTNLRNLGGPSPEGSAQALIDKLDIRAGEETAGWSLRTARRIVGYRRSASVNLVQTDTSIDWDENPSNPYVTYKVTYQNRGGQRLVVDAEVQCVGVLRSDRNNPLTWQKLSAKNHRFELGPAERRTFEGSLRWDGSSGNRMPRLIIPPSAGGLISIEYVGREPAALGLRGSPVPLAFNAKEQRSFQAIFTRVIQASVGGFLGLRVGPGVKLDDVVEYPAEVNFPGAMETTVRVPEDGNRDEAEVSVAFARDVPMSDARIVYERAAGQLADAGRDYGIAEDGDDHREDGYWLARFSNDRFLITVTNLRSRSGWSVDMSIKSRLRD